MNKSEKIEKLHQVSLLLLKEADSKMRENSIGYMLDAGTLLGAIRHRDFIPWDDDCDICMTRENYDKFLEIAPQLFTGDFGFILPDGKESSLFYDFVPKIVYNKVKISQKGMENEAYGEKYSHPALDIFVIDKVPNTIIGQRLHTKLLVFIYGLAMGHRDKIDYSKYSFVEKGVVFILSSIGKLISLKRLALWYDKAAAMFKNSKKTKVMSTHSAMDHFGDVYESEWYEKENAGVIRENVFPIPVGYEGVLTKHYNDYMALPPEEKRVGRHIDFCVFEEGN